VDLLALLEKHDTWARIEIARYFNKICREKEIQGYDEETINKIKGALLFLTKDDDPEHDDISQGIN
jgi:hypothetical protein